MNLKRKIVPDDKSNTIENFKGIYYNDNQNDQKLYEFGSHFNYLDLCTKLKNLIEKISPERRGAQLNECTNSQKSKSSKLFLESVIPFEIECKVKFNLSQLKNNLTKALNINNVCNRIQNCLDKKTGSIHGNLISEFTKKENTKKFSQIHSKDQLENKIILNSIININITNINNNDNNKKKVLNKEPKANTKKIINKIKDKTNNKYQQFISYSKKSKQLNKKEYKSHFSNNITTKLIGKFKFNGDSNLINSMDVHISKEINELPTATEAVVFEKNFSPTHKKLNSKFKLQSTIKKANKSPYLDYVNYGNNSTNLTNNKLRINNTLNSAVSKNPIKNNEGENESLNYNFNYLIKSRNANRDIKEKYDSSQVPTLKSKSQQKMNNESKKTINKSKEKIDISIYKNIKSTYNLYKKSCTNKLLKGFFNKSETLKDKFKLQFLDKLNQNQTRNISSFSKKFSKNSFSKIKMNVEENTQVILKK